MSMASLTRTPKKKKELSGKLRPWFRSGKTEKEQFKNRDFHNAQWKPYEAFGIQPCDKGVQIYHQPQSVAAIRMVAKVLLEIASRMEQK